MNSLRKKRKNRVTIIVGLIGRQDDPETNAIVLASDSQTTWVTMQRSDADKMSEITFADGKKALVAQSGDSTLGSRTVEMLQNDAHLVQCNDYRKPAELAEEAIRKVKRDAVRLNNWEPGQAVSQQFLDDYNFSLMLAYYFGDPAKPYIFILDSPLGVANMQRDYAAIGCGATVAEVMLSRSDVSALHSHEAAITAIYTVEEVKRVDAFCGGPTKLAVIFQNGNLIMSRDAKGLDYVKFTVETITKYDREAKAVWRGFIQKIVDEADKSFKAKYPRF